MTVSFRTEFSSVVIAIFEEAFRHAHMQLTETRGTNLHYTFLDDTYVRDARAWLSDAIGCGLITMGAVSVN